MAAGTVVQNVQVASNYLDCDSCLSPSRGLLSPRISFSKDFGQSDSTEKASFYKGKDKVERDSMSEFEFCGMSLRGHESASSNQMLAADELFFKGKLLPLYVPQYIEKSEQRSGKMQRKEGEMRQISARKSADQLPTTNVFMPAPASAITLHPPSPKTPRCSSKLKELFGLRKVRSQSFQEGSRTSEKIATQQRSPLASKAKRLFWKDDAKVLEARNSTAEPLLASIFEGRASSASSIGEGRASSASSVISFQQSQQIKQHILPDTPLKKYASLPENLSTSDLYTPLSTGVSRRVQGPAVAGTNRKDYEEGMSPHLRVKLKAEEHINVKNSRRAEDGMGIEATFRARDGAKATKNRKSSGSAATSPGRKSGTMSPTGHNWSPGRHSSAGAVSPGRLSLGELSFGSLERSRSSSSSSSPTSLRKRYDHWKAVRQREWWRGQLLERSSSYSSSVRVTPVLNVPVCMNSALRSGSAARPLKPNNSSGLGQFLYAATKPASSKIKLKPAPSPPLSSSSSSSSSSSASRVASAIS